MLRTPVTAPTPTETKATTTCIATHHSYASWSKDLHLLSARQPFSSHTRGVPFIQPVHQGRAFAAAISKVCPPDPACSPLTRAAHQGRASGVAALNLTQQGLRRGQKVFLLVRETFEAQQLAQWL